MEEDKSEETVTLSTPSLLEASVDGILYIHTLERYSTVYIRESVDSLCRDGADARIT